MATSVFESKVNSDGRAVIPAELRHRMGLRSGDQIQFILGADGHVRIATRRSMAEELWANNHGGDVVDIGAKVRANRDDDALGDAVSLGEQLETGDDEYSEEQRSAVLLAALGL